MEKAEQLISVSGLDWVIVRPSFLTNGELTQKFRVSEKFRPKSGKSISPGGRRLFYA
jgi:uncharacterized protein YbjT (DUF2867 family)